MLDTGAEMSCVRKEKAKQLLSFAKGNKDIAHLVHTKRTCRAANGSSMPITADLVLTFTIADTKYTVNFAVVDGLSQEMLIGDDFMRQNITLFNNKDSYLLLQDGTKVPFYRKRATETHTAHVGVLGNHTVPAGKSIMIPVQAAKNFPEAHVTAIFVPKVTKSKRMKPTGLEIVTVNNRVANIMFENHTDVDIQLTPHAIGAIVEIKDTQISTLAELQMASSAKAKEEGNRSKDETHIQRERRNAPQLSPHKRAEKTDHLRSVINSVHTEQMVTANDRSTNKKSTPSTAAAAQTHLPTGFEVLKALTPAQQNEVIELVKKYNHAFVQNENDHGLTHLTEHKIELSEKTPLHIRQFPLDRKRTDAVEEWVDKLIALDKVEISDSPWNTPVFVVPKSNGNGWRIVNDFRQLNQKTKKMEWPLPSVQHAIDSLGGSKYFTQIDLSDAFFQIPLSREHREYTAFNAGSRHVQYKVMPMGLCNSTATFQRLMSQIFHDIPWVKPFVDDLIVAASSFQELLERTEIVFQRLLNAGLKMSGKKTYIGLTEVKYLGYICSADGIRMDPKKIETIQKWPKPITVTQLRQFLGLCSHLRRHIKDFAKIANPLTKQQGGPKDAKIKWGEEETKAFFDLKEALSDPNQCLAYPDLSPDADKFIVETDACKVSEGAVLKQVQNGVERVIAYASRSFTPTEKAYFMTELEAHAIFWAITKQFHYYLQSSNKPFDVRTDHKPCLALKVKKVAAERLYRWALALQGYDMEIYYINGKKHVMSDAISRLGYLRELYEKMKTEEQVMNICIEDNAPSQKKGRVPIEEYEVLTIDITNIQENHTKNFDDMYPKLQTALMEAVLPPMATQPTGKMKQEKEEMLSVYALSGAGYQYAAILEAQQKDEGTKDLWSYLKNGTQPSFGKRSAVQKLARECFLENDIIYRRGGVYQKQLLVPLCLREQMLIAMHDAPSSGHFGVFNTLHRLSKHYWWPGMSYQVYKYVRSCKECSHRNIPPHMRVRAPAVKDEVPRLFERVAVDVQGEFTMSKNGNRFLVTFMDVHSRWIEAFPVKEVSALTIAKLLVKEIILRYGPIRILSSDRASNFLSDVIRETCRIFQIQKMNIAAYHPEANAHVERVHRVYSDAISKYINLNHNDWDEIFPYVQWAYRSSVQATLQASPYELVFGREAVALADLAMLPPPPDKVKPDVEKWRQDLSLRIQKGQEFTIKLQEQAMERLLAKSSQQPPRTVKVGDKVMIRNHTAYIDTENRRTHKWEPRFIGPYLVRERQGEVTYLVANPADNSDKRVIRIDDMKRFYPRVMRKPQHVRIEDLPVTGDSHGFDTIDDDECEVERILDRRLWSRAGKKNEYEYLVRYKNLPFTHDEWVHESDLFAPDLIERYNRETDEQFRATRHIKTTRSGKVKRPMVVNTVEEPLSKRRRI